ncbi:uncharacterized protein L3040_001478 [Drepanopeziza brunnea f. sp. 'multigermtubi']|uniref:uncharacterized protein n=1 Tax=Drepanopeziza brunnea f. sp. 'multigermtubi' TaxID=698441 RepID=UPI0023A6B3F8|nr:hypothetical protein L3040_001478 [Drepanopeziza brunnea f. sp. 'multigermtubi']
MQLYQMLTEKWRAIMTMIEMTLLLFQLFGFYLYSPTSICFKMQFSVILLALATYTSPPEPVGSSLSDFKDRVFKNSPASAAFLVMAVIQFKLFQRVLRFERIKAIKSKYGYTEDSATWKDMTIDQAQEIERNIAEWEFPRLFQFAWVSGLLRALTNPGVSRALIKSGYMVNLDQILIISRINEHHHRYGKWINSDDVLYLIIHFAMAPVSWINKFGYRSLEGFEVDALRILWRELGCRMGVKCIPETLDQAKEWRTKFEETSRWRADTNQTAGMALMNQIMWSVPSMLKPLTRKILVSILDWDVVHFCQFEKLGRSLTLRSTAFSFFRLCGFCIREFGAPRYGPYKRVPDGPNKNGLINFGHTPYDTLPFFQERSLWNLYGYGALLRRAFDIPLPSPRFYSGGIAIESMGAPQDSAETQAMVDEKVRENAAVLEQAPYGYRPAIGYQAGRLLRPVDGPSYGLDMNTFPELTILIPASTERFENKFQRRALGFLED